MRRTSISVLCFGLSLWAGISTAQPSTQAGALKAFLDAAQELDGQVRSVSMLYASGVPEWYSRAVSMPAVENNPLIPPDLAARYFADTTKPVVLVLNEQDLESLIPPGLPSDLEAAVLGVWADLDSRIAGLRWAYYHRDEAPDISRCASNAIGSEERFTEKMMAVTTLVTDEPWTKASPDSVIAGILQVRLEILRALNHGCDSRGGALYAEAIEVNWDEGTAHGVGFTAEFRDGQWKIHLRAC